MHDELRRRLMDGRFLPGQAISLRRLAAELGTSAMPVREALRRLRAEHAVELLPNRTLVIARATRARVLELFELRAALEGLVAARAALHASAELVPRLEAINDALMANVRADDRPASLRLNQQFHLTLAAASGSELLRGFVESLWLRVGPFLFLSYLEGRTRGMTWGVGPHEDLIAALRVRDAARARRAIEADVESATRFLLLGIDEEEGG